MSILELSGASPIRNPTPAPVQAVRPVEAPKPPAAPLEPAVRVDIRSGDRPAPAVEEERPVEAAPVDQNERRVRIDEDTKSLVYQVVDPASGDIVVQLPDPVVLKARAYAEAAAAKLQSNERPLDRTA
ncbi:MAG: hypothetical protein K2Y56_12900 [Methylobacterium sp.]|uniref:hypothetical protein n=1 Tax=Methylobacterium sp. TaxID=409 RepID=UPI0025F8FF08|nr:hypothetical protein [Methylobacterium sp.]MBX9932418.1 hypothetical protein [Methylobacterium sp.]